MNRAILWQRLCVLMLAGTVNGSWIAPLPTSAASPEDLPPQRQADVRAYAALATPVTCRSFSQPLGTTIADLRRQMTVPLVVDWGVLQGINVTPDHPVTIDVEDVPARLALNLLLRTIDPTLTWTIDDGTLLITTQEIRSMQIRIYWIGDLIEGERIKDHCDKLADAIQILIEPETWDIEGGYGQLVVLPQHESLVCTQTFEVHQEIRTLLTDLRKSPDPAQALADVIIIRSDDAQPDTALHERGARFAERRGPKIDTNPAPWRVPQRYDN